MPSQNFVYADVDGPHRLLRARTHSAARVGRRLAAGRRLDRRRRVDRLGSVRRAAAHSTIRRSTSSSRPTIGRRRPTYRVQPRPRVDRAVPRAADHRPARRPTDRTTRSSFTPDDFARIQADTVSLHAKALLPLLLQHAQPRRGDRRSAGARHPARDGTSTRPRDSAADRDLPGLVSAADAGAGRRRARSGGRPTPTPGKFSFVSRFLADTLAANDSPWCDDVTTPQRETCDDAVTEALQQGRRRSAAPPGHRHDTLAVGRRAPRDVPARARLGRGAAADPQPLGRRSAATGARSTSASAPRIIRTKCTRSPATARSSISRRPTTAASSTRSANPATRCRRTTTISCRTGARCTHRKMRMDRADIDRGALGHLRITPP